MKVYVGETYMTNEDLEVSIIASRNISDKYRFEGSNSKMYSEDGSCKDGTRLSYKSRKSCITEVKTIGDRSVAICSLEQFRDPSKITKATLIENVISKMSALVKNLKF